MNLKHIQFYCIGVGILLERLLFTKRTESLVSDILVVDVSRPSLRHSTQELQKYSTPNHKFRIELFELTPDCLLKIAVKKKLSPKPFLKSHLAHQKFTRLPEAKARSPD